MCDMDETGGPYAKWYKPDKERQILYNYNLYVKSKNKTKKSPNS